MVMYLTNCAGACLAAEPTKLDWFKIDQVGQSVAGKNARHLADISKLIVSPAVSRY
jgi:hypothetical protein